MKKYFFTLLGLAMGVCAMAQTSYIIPFNASCATTGTEGNTTMSDPIRDTKASANFVDTYTYDCDDEDFVLYQMFTDTKGFTKGANITVGVDSYVTIKTANGCTMEIVCPSYDGLKVSDIELIGYSNNDTNPAYISNIGQYNSENVYKNLMTVAIAPSTGNEFPARSIVKTEGQPDVCTTQATVSLKSLAPEIDFTKPVIYKNGGKQLCLLYRIIYVDADSTPIKNINADSSSKSIKTIENGKVIIIRDGVKYNLAGAVVE